MLTLITGLPGNGKTLYALQSVVARAKSEGRQVWYHGINGLKLELGWHVVPTKVEKINGRDEEVPQWWTCPAKSIIVIDEAQKAGFGVRPRGQVPEWGQKLETHRHLGLDIVFITQDPSLIDSHDRKLIEMHFHVMRSFGMQRAVVHEFRPVRENVLKSRKGSIEHRWKYPKHVFEWYTSAEAHTHKARVPMKVWIFLALPFLVLGLAWLAWSKFLDPHRVRSSGPLAEATPGAVAATRNDGASASKPAAMTREEYVQQHRPRVDGLAYTAPVYDEVTKPVVAPYPAAAVLMGSKGCRAYSQQGTRLDVPDALCRQIVERGFFVAWQQPQAAPVAPVKAETPVVAPQEPTVAVIGGRPRMDMAPGPSPRYDGYIEQSAPTNRPSRPSPG